MLHHRFGRQAYEALLVDDLVGERRRRRIALADITDHLIRIRCQGRHINEADHFGIDPHLGDEDATPGMADENDRTGLQASVRLVAATSSANEVKGFCTAITL